MKFRPNEEDGQKLWIAEQTEPFWRNEQLQDVTEEDVLIYSNGSTLYFKGLTTEYKVFNISGKLIYKGTETSLSLPKGSYIVRINNQVAKVVL